MHDSANGITAQTRPFVGRGFRLQWEPAQNSHVLLYPEGMVKLNGSAGEIVSRCDGKRTLDEIVADLESAFNATGLSSEVADFVAFAVEKKWLEIRP
jgi:pyrroloquinoline quinone biosynthesis protein D